MTRWRVPLGFLFAAFYLYVAKPSSLYAIYSAIVLIVLGCWLRAWAAGYLFKGKRVAVGGPYAWVRNPLYVGSFIIAAGFCLILWQTPLTWQVIGLWLAFLIGYGVVYRRKTLDEEKELTIALGEAYQNYAKQVPPFLPLRGHVPGLGVQTFSWELYKRNREYECLIGCVFMLACLFWKWYRGA